MPRNDVLHRPVSAWGSAVTIYLVTALIPVAAIAGASFPASFLTALVHLCWLLAAAFSAVWHLRLIRHDRATALVAVMPTGPRELMRLVRRRLRRRKLLLLALATGVGLFAPLFVSPRAAPVAGVFCCAGFLSAWYLGEAVALAAGRAERRQMDLAVCVLCLALVSCGVCREVCPAGLGARALRALRAHEWLKAGQATAGLFLWLAVSVGLARVAEFLVRPMRLARLLARPPRRGFRLPRVGLVERAMERFLGRKRLACGRFLCGPRAIESFELRAAAALAAAVILGLAGVAAAQYVNSIAQSMRWSHSDVRAACGLVTVYAVAGGAIAAMFIAGLSRGRPEERTRLVQLEMFPAGFTDQFWGAFVVRSLQAALAAAAAGVATVLSSGSLRAGWLVFAWVTFAGVELVFLLRALGPFAVFRTRDWPVYAALAGAVGAAIGMFALAFGLGGRVLDEWFERGWGSSKLMVFGWVAFTLDYCVYVAARWTYANRKAGSWVCAPGPPGVS